MARSAGAARRLAGLRILSQGLVRTAEAPSPHALARGFGAHQGQDLPGVVASLALRSGGDPHAVTAAFDSGEIVRGYPMRGTVFALAAEDLRWMTQLCAGAPVRAAIKRRTQLNLEDSHVHTAREVLERVAGPASTAGSGRGVLRGELLAEWERAGVDPGRGRGYHLLVHLISTGVAAYGPWRDGETAVVLAEEWLPRDSGLAERFAGDEAAATAELLHRYLTSHGPATLRDFAWWTKLPLTAIREAVPIIEDRLESADPGACGVGPAGGETVYFRPGLLEEFAELENRAMAEFLLPGFDELVLGYQDRLFLMTAEHHEALVPGRNGVFRRGAFRRGRLVGVWSHTGASERRRLVLEPLLAVSQAQSRRFEQLFARFPYIRA